jgi:hydrogenase maturation protease
MKSGGIEISSQHSNLPRGTVLVVGFGNTLRGDDGVGPRAASAVAGWDLPGVIAKAVPQLTPELAEPLATARFAIFIDARLAAERDVVQLQSIGPSDTGRGAALGHMADPRCLLTLVQTAYGTCPRSWLVKVPALDLSFGEGLSPVAQRGLEEALRQIAALFPLRWLTAKWARQDTACRDKSCIP